MMILGYSNIWVSGFYIASIGLLCLHLSHGLASMFQSMGLKNKFYGKWIDCGARATALVLFVGNCSIPLAVLFGVIR
jgi:succinate dehydrogenase / fumarate reductase cytochrome b subunit